MLDLEQLNFRTRALGQAHPFTPASYRYLNHTVAHERMAQPVEQLGIWAGHALTAGYCLRRVEEDDVGRVLAEAPEPLPADLDEASTLVAERIRTDGAAPYLLYGEERVVEALDRLIAGEIERRLSHWEETIDEESWTQLEDYIAWWVIKGYALRIVEQITPSASQAK